jgi:chromosome partitioning protein
MAIVISTVNMKGGVGKTTLTVNLATCLARDYGQRVLVLDLDSQISATLSLMSPYDFANVRKKKRTLNYLIDITIRPNYRKTLTIDDIIVPSICDIDKLSLLPGDIELYDEYIVSETLHQKAINEGKENFEEVWNYFESVLIRNIIAPIENNYDFIIMDCAPGYNLLTRSGIAASNFYILPARPEPLSIVGMQLLERRIARLIDNHDGGAEVKAKLLGVVFILSANTLLGRYYNQVMKRVREDFSEERIFQNAIPMDVNVAKAVDMFMPVVLSSPNSPGSKAFVKLTEECIYKLQNYQ